MTLMISSWRPVTVESHRWPRWLLVFLFSLIPCGAELHAQTLVGHVVDVGKDQTIQMEVDTASALRPGIIVYAVQYDSAAADYVAKGEIALESVFGTTASGRLLGGGTGIAVGDQVAFYGTIQPPGLDLRISPSGANLLVGETTVFEAELVDENRGALQNVTASWGSSNSSIIEVTQSGQVAGVGPGEATVTASTSSGLVAVARVRVLPGMMVAPDEMVAFVGTRDTIQVILEGPHRSRPVGASLDWMSDNPAIVGVDSIGMLEPRSPGTATVIGTGHGDRIEVSVRVYPQPVQVSFRPPEGDIEVVRGDTITLNASVLLPDDIWLEAIPVDGAPRDSFYLEPMSTGGLYAVREGETRVWARMGQHRARWDVTVVKPDLEVVSPGGAVLLGSDVELRASFARRDGSLLGQARGVHWQSLTPEVLELADGRARAVAPGQARVLVVDGQTRDTATVYVLGDLIAAVRTPEGPRIGSISMADGRVYLLDGGRLAGREPSLSPDGTRLVYVGEDAGFPRIFLARADGLQKRLATPDVSGPFGLPHPLYQEASPQWSAEGQRLLYLSNHSGSYDAYALPLGGGDVLQLTDTPAQERGLAAARDGEHFAVERLMSASESDVLLSLLGFKETMDIVADSLAGSDFSGPAAWERHPAFIPGVDRLLLLQIPPGKSAGQRLVEVDYAEPNNPEVFTRIPAKPGHAIKFAVSPDGKRLVYMQYPTDGDLSVGQLVEMRLSDGEVLRTAPVPDPARILALSWGADTNVEEQP